VGFFTPLSYQRLCGLNFRLIGTSILMLAVVRITFNQLGYLFTYSQPNSDNLRFHGSNLSIEIRWRHGRSACWTNTATQILEMIQPVEFCLDLLQISGDSIGQINLFSPNVRT